MIRRALLLPFLLGFFIELAMPPSVLASNQNERMLSIVARMEDSYSRITDYEAIFHKQERIGGKLLPEETILLKFKKPLNVYMKWIEKPYKGTEALYVAGKYDNKLIVHRGGILKLLTLSLDPRGSVALKTNRHPITEIGFGFLIEGLLRNIQEAVQNGDFEAARIEDEPFMGRAAIVVEARFHPHSGRKYYASRMICYIDKDLFLPIDASFYDEKDRLFEKYYYTDVKINVGLTAGDFSRDNKGYDF